MIDVATKTSYHPRNKYFYFFSQIVVADKFYLLFPANIAARPWVPALAPSLNNYHRRQKTNRGPETISSAGNYDE